MLSLMNMPMLSKVGNLRLIPYFYVVYALTKVNPFTYKVKEAEKFIPEVNKMVLKN